METEIRHLLDCRVVGADGQEIGKVGQVYLNDSTGDPEWVTVRTGFFGVKQTFVPLVNSRRSAEEIRVPFDKEMIRGAPNIDVDGRLSLEEEAELYRYYGMQPTGIPSQRRGERRADLTSDATGKDRGNAKGRRETSRGTPETSRDMSGQERYTRDGDLDMTRSEERLHVGTERRECGRVRLHKYVDTEHVQQKVPLTREEARFERQPITGDEALRDYPIGEDVQEFIIYEERPVVGTETTPVERMRVYRERVRREETVEGDIRKERIEVEQEGLPLDRNRDLPRDR
jgi:uncharacterized protein (TIGR02271 family)